MKYPSIMLKCWVAPFILLLMSVQVSLAQEQDSTLMAKVRTDKVIFSFGYHVGVRLKKTDGFTFQERERSRNQRIGHDVRAKAMLPQSGHNAALGIMLSRYQTKAPLSTSSQFQEIDYIGIVYQQYTQTGNNNQHLWAMEYSLGYIHFQSWDFQSAYGYLKGDNLGISVGGSYRYMFSPKVGMGLNLHLEGTSLGQLKTGSGDVIDLENAENVFRVSLGFGVDIRL